MIRRAPTLPAEGGRPENGTTGGPPAPRGRRPNLTGDLETLLPGAPVFRTALRGYDRLQVDNYVAWAEGELVAVRRENEDLLSKYGVCSAELEVSRRLLAHSPEGREMTRTSERVGEILRLAADEAAELTAAGAAEADRLRAEARTEADTLLRRAHDIKAAAVAASDAVTAEAQQLREKAAIELEEARADAAAERTRARTEAAALRETARSEAAAVLERAHAEAAAEVERARAEAAAVLGEAAAERARLDDEAAQERSQAAAAAERQLAAAAERARQEEQAAAAAAAAQLAEVTAEVEELQRRRERTQTFLRQVGQRVDEALRVLAGTPADPAHSRPDRTPMAS